MVTTNFNALDGYRKYIQVANEQLSFEQAILLAHAEITPAVNFEQLESINDLLKITDIKNTRKDLVSHESWESRATDVQCYLAMC